MSENNERILDQLTCPICLVHPETEVYQCHSGHPICATCIQPLKNCPQCQVPFGVPRIRCRLMESLLDTVSFPCVNKDAGCLEQFLKKELPDHHKTCEFRSVSLCKWMGFNCDFKYSTIQPLIQHLETRHNAKRWSNISLVSKKFSPFRKLFLQECPGIPQSPKKTWILVLATLAVEPNEQQFFSCVPIHLQDRQSTAEHQVHLDVFYHQEQKKRLLSKWTGYPLNYKDAEVDILHPSFRLTTNCIKKHALKLNSLSDFKLNLSFSVTVKPI